MTSFWPQVGFAVLSRPFHSRSPRSESAHRTQPRTAKGPTAPHLLLVDAHELYIVKLDLGRSTRSLKDFDRVRCVAMPIVCPCPRPLMLLTDCWSCCVALCATIFLH